MSIAILWLYSSMASKNEREILVNKYGGKCAYCGGELTKGWHIDELEPIRRNKKWDRKKRKWIYDGTCKHPERLCIENQMPACASCNINKHAMSLEEFRRLVGGFLTSLNGDSTQYKIAKRYGFIEEVVKPVVFYFEAYPAEETKFDELHHENNKLRNKLLRKSL